MNLAGQTTESMDAIQMRDTLKPATSATANLPSQSVLPGYSPHTCRIWTQENLPFDTLPITRELAMTTTLKYFSYKHLPLALQGVSKPIAELAEHFERLLPEGPEKSAGMRKLLEAKDCFVRASLPDE